MSLTFTKEGTSVYLDDDARGDVLQHHTVAGFVGGLAPGAVPFHKLLFEFRLIQGRRSGAVLPARRLDRGDRRRRGEQRPLLPRPEAPRRGADSGQGCRPAEAGRGTHAGALPSVP